MLTLKDHKLKLTFINHKIIIIVHAILPIENCQHDIGSSQSTVLYGVQLAQLVVGLGLLDLGLL